MGRTSGDTEADGLSNAAEYVLALHPGQSSAADAGTRGRRYVRLRRVLPAD